MFVKNLGFNTPPVGTDAEATGDVLQLVYGLVSLGLFNFFVLCAL
jgi:hypothetical protein